MDNINNYSYDTPQVLTGGVTFSQNGGYFEIGADQNKKVISNNNTISINQITMGLDYHFKLNIEGLHVNSKMNNDIYNSFLPVESIALTPVSLESQRINIGVFSDLPILNKRRMGRLRVILLDDVNNVYENAVLSWFRQSCGSGGFVLPLSKIIRQADYVEYTNSGKLSKHYRFWVIPDEDITLNRKYNENSLKHIEFSTLIVGDILQVHAGETASYSKRTVSGESFGTVKEEAMVEPVTVDELPGNNLIITNPTADVKPYSRIRSFFKAVKRI